jgi:parvulin-like peptidyl-prolyl isomerase
MIRSKLTIVPLVAASAMALTSCKPPQPTAPATVEATPTPAKEAAAAPAAQPEVKQVASAPAEVTAPSADAPKPPVDAKPIVLPEVVATVNGQNITSQQLEEIFKAAVEGSGQKAASLTNEQKLGAYNQLLQELIMDKLVAGAAAGEKVTDADVDAEIAKVKKQFPDEKIFEEQLKQAGQTPEKLKENLRTMLQQQLWMKSQVKTSDVTEAQAQTFYDSNKKEFDQPETVKASHILFMVKPEASEADVTKQKEAATKASERATKGEDFSTLAKELSEEPGAKESAGDLGFFTKDRMVPEFANAAFSQKIGDISQPVRTQFGWHVIKVTETKAAGTVPFAEVKDQITGYLKSTNQREAVQAVLKKLKDSAKVETFLPTAA